MLKDSTSYKRLKLHQYHSKELKIRLLYILFTWILSFGVFFINMDFIIYKCSFTEFSKVLINTNTEINTQGLIFTEIFEGFLSYVIFSGYLACLVTLPVLYYHIYNFLLPGISFTEAKFFKSFFYLSVSLMSLAHLIAYILIIPYAISFFLNFQSGFNLETLSNLFQEPKTQTNMDDVSVGMPLDETKPESVFWGVTFLGRVYPWITFLINLFTIVNIAFQLPLILFTLFVLIKPYSSSARQTLNANNLPKDYGNQFRLEQLQSIYAHGNTYSTDQGPIGSFEITAFLRKVLLFALVVLTAVFSPPDIYSQIFLLVPLIVVIEIFLFWVFFYLEYLNYTQHSIPNKSN